MPNSRHIKNTAVFNLHTELLHRDKNGEIQSIGMFGLDSRADHESKRTAEGAIVLAMAQMYLETKPDTMVVVSNTSWGLGEKMTGTLEQQKIACAVFNRVMAAIFREAVKKGATVDDDVHNELFFMTRNADASRFNSWECTFSPSSPISTLKPRPDGQSKITITHGSIL